MMNSLANVGLSNAAVAFVLAAAVAVVTRVWRSPPLAHALWLLVLLKLVSPSLLGVALSLLGGAASPVQQVRNAEPNAPDFDVRAAGTAVDDMELPVAAPIDLPALSVPLELPDPPMAMDQDDTEANPSPLPTVNPFAVEASAASMDREPTYLTDEPVATAPTVIQPAAGLRDLLWQYSRRAPPLIAGMWLVGAAIWFFVVGRRLRRFRQLLARTDDAPEALREEVARLAAGIGLRVAPDVRLLDAAIPPLAWAVVGRPLLLLPRELLVCLDDDERTTLLAHELAHLCRRDHLVRWLEIAVVGLYWWNPVAWFARRQLHAAAEACCDAWVVRRLPGHARAYANALWKTVDFLADARPVLPVGATGFGQAKHLKRRFAMILEGRRTDRLSRVLYIALALVGLVVLPLSIRTLWADESQPPTPAAPVPATAPTATAPMPPPTPTAPAVGPAPAPTPPTAAPAIAPVRRGEPTLAPPQEPPAIAPPASPAATAVPRRTVYVDAPTIQGTAPNGRPGIAVEPPATDGNDIDARLRRLESMMETLVTEVRTLKSKPLQGNDSNSGEFKVPDPATQAVPYRSSPTPAASTPLSVRASMAARRDAQLREARENALLRDPELEASHHFADLERSFRVCETNHNRKVAAAKNLESVEAAYAKGEATLDVLLEARRRAAESEIAYAQSLYDLKYSGPTAADSASKLARVKLVILGQAHDQALKTWREERAQFEKAGGNGESEKEAQAREQYFMFRGQVDDAGREFNSARVQERENGSDRYRRREPNKPKSDTKNAGEPLPR